MGVIESIIMIAKMVPEAMIHPISQLVEHIGMEIDKYYEPASRNEVTEVLFSL
jgi:hypothetical protein